MATPWAPSSALAWAVYAAGFTYDPAQDIILSRMDALQRNFGYAYGYDAAALGMSMVIDAEPIFFDYDNKHWMIELWKGQYGLESGCEVGVYTRPIGSTGPGYVLLDATVGRRPGDGVASHNLFYDCAADGERLQLRATLKRDGQALFTRGPELHWWLTGFKWGVFSHPSQLSVDVAITLKDNAMLQAFMAGIAGRPYPNLRVDGTTVSFTFDRPYAVPQPPRPAAVLAAVNAWNQKIVSTYNGLGFPNNDPNQVQAGFLSVAGLGLLHLTDSYGLTACRLAVQIGQSVATVVTGLVDGLNVAAGTVEAWWSGAGQAFGAWVSAIENYLGLPLDFSCYVEIDNTRGASDLVLTGSSVGHGSYVVGPPTWIPKGTVARLILQDPKPSVYGSQGSATYRYADASLAMKSVTFSYEDPSAIWNPNKASASQAGWTTFAKSGDPNGAWSASVPSGGHPLFVRYVISGGAVIEEVVREVGDLLHLAGVTDDGRLWHTLRAPDGAWHQFINVEDVAGEGGHLVDVDLRHVGRDVHLCAVSSTGQLWHTVRRADGSWLPFGDVKSQAGDRGQVANVGIAEVSGELHVCAAAGDGRLWHTVRRADGSWLPFGDVEGPAGERGTFRGVDCAGIADGLHVAGVTADGRSWHSLRKGDGSWTGFGDIEAQSGEIGTVTDVACASVTGELHVACVTDDGTVWHTVRRQDGRWTRFGTPQGMTGRPGAFARVGVGESGGVLHLAGTTRDGRLWHTIRRADGSWLPFGDVEGEAGERGRFTALSADGLFVPENPECVQIRADLASIRGRIRELEAEKDDLNPRTNGPQIRLINEQIAQLNQRASQLRERAWRIDCPV